MSRIPSLFVSHGSPMFAVEPGLLGPNLVKLGQELQDQIKAIVIVSPHWQALRYDVTGVAAPETIHDFGGFPPELYRLQYNPPGEPQLATRVSEMLNAAGLPSRVNPDRGLDHGAWVPLLYLAPAAKIPVIQVAMPMNLNPQDAFALGQALAPLRDEGILVIGSGSMTHNLYEFRQHINDPEYAQQFADWVRETLDRKDTESMLDYRRRAPHSARAHPTEEHFVPLMVAMGAAGADDNARLVEGGMTYSTLSMDSYLFG